ncbi:MULTISPECIES: stage III sporulation protein SpoIIIAB [Niallia]|jgi:stage III sporulation protein AB|uniref:stage III sporulation protein SpoIIIAB n=1 Tax=Niallia TaxID=2837506 RepID=UPI0002ED99A3|nr:stage III sporulation protein SpoIIIAB [Niallia circulans]NRG29983.1 stage III sporulation protein SpoAB [Niallia circulans]QJX62915.1 stage III sporulation protein SpoAB [Niallia circulans]
MIKIIGAILILASTSWGGMEFSKLLSQRPKQIRALKSALQSLEAEIMYGHTPLHEASRRLAEQLNEPLRSFFAGFAERLLKEDTTVKEAWTASLHEIWKKTAMKDSELEIMKQFGETLGRHDRFSQQKQIMLTLTHLEREEEEAREIQGKYEKMIRSLGFLSGLLIVILLM